ncbi:MAG: tetratricopeptide repeat protein [Betaproteobacteria bacterium]|nr:tetratricopeptide repeat protein [Betaproteobacteria bacterium]
MRFFRRSTAAGNGRTAQQAQALAARLPAWKKFLFGAMVVALVLALAELALSMAGVAPRLATDDPFVGFAASLPLFVEKAQSDGTVMMETAHDKLGHFNRQSFPKVKAQDTVRIFCIGGSTTYGNPYRDVTSFCGWLREMLPVADPSRRWELINAGGISYASYREAALMEELARYEPDVFIVLSAQNEFVEQRSYGPMRELPSPILEGTALLARTRLYTAMDGAIRAAGLADRGRYTLSATVNDRLANFVGPQDYHRDDALAGRIGEHFGWNLARMAAIGRAAGARVVMVTPPVNMKDISPFKSEHRENMTAADLSRWSALDARGRQALDRGAPDEAAEAFAAALALDPRHAETHFLLGRALFAMGRFEAAKQSFQRAVDEDICPLRALSSMQATVRSVAARQKLPLVDFIRLVEDENERRLGHRIPGNELFLDHVHPTIEVNRLLALALIEALNREGVVRFGPEWGAQAQAQVTQKVLARLKPTDHADAIQHLGRLFGWAGRLEEAHALLLRALEMYGHDQKDTLLLLAMSSERRGKPEEAIGYYRRIAAFRDIARLSEKLGRDVDAAAAYAELVRQHPDDAHSRVQYAATLIRLDRIDAARGELDAALRLVPGLAEARGELANLYLRQERFDAAIREYEALLAQRPDDFNAHYNLAIALLRTDRLAQAVAHSRQAITIRPDSAPAHVGLASALAAQGLLDQAVAEYHEALRRDPLSAEAHNNFGILLARTGRLDQAVEHFREALAATPTFEEARHNLALASAEMQRVKERVASGSRQNVAAGSAGKSSGSVRDHR